MARIGRKKNNQGISLIEVMTALTILSTLILPLFMFLIEYAKGGSDIGDRFEILNRIEERLETALSMPFDAIPEGLSKDITIESEKGKTLDLKPIKISNKQVSFECMVETIPTNFEAIKNYNTHQIQRAKIENGLKKITITAKWGKDNNSREIQLMVYKANL
ncbi:MAG: prepilin-type N-terminal cleavage/methylation domain-containing protein [Candidatus Riflebacteria bacterium]|nr:prepilin-type N-terminal cleavage/methylation domain-containing protein [Candidatus Riflebacteria bacterium]